MPESLLDRAVHAVHLATSAGAQGAFAHAHRSRSSSCEVRNGNVEKLQQNTSRSLSIELYVDGRFSAHSTTDLRDRELERFVREAVALTRMLEPDPHRALPDPSLFGGSRPTELDLVDSGVATLDQDQRIELCQRMNDRVKNRPRVISASSYAFDDHGQVAAASSNGFQGEYEATHAGMYASATMQDDGDSRPEDGMGMSARHRSMLEEPEWIGDRALERAMLRLGTKKGPTTTTTMLVDRMAAGSLIARLIGPASGGAIQQKRSMWDGQLGKRRISRKLTIVNDPTLPRALGSRPFDREGITAFSMPVIESGALKNYFLDTYYARKLGTKPTTGSWANLVVTPGKRDFAALLAATTKGIYVTSWLGGNSDSTTGDFSLGLRGHFVERGKLGAPIGEMNVTGNLLGLFSNLVEVGGDPWTYEQVRVPTLVFEKVQFSGT